MAPLPVKPASPPAPAGAGDRGDMLAQQFKLRMQIAENLRRIRHQVVVMSGKGGVGKSTVAVNLAAAFAEEGWRVGLLDLDLTNPNVPLMLNVEGEKPRGSESGRIVPVKVRVPAAGGGSGARERERARDAAGEPHGGSPDPHLVVMSTAFFLEGRKDAIVWRGPIKMKMIQDLLGQVDWGDLDVLVVDLPPGTGDEPLTVAQLLKDADGVVTVTTPQSVSVLDVRKSLSFAATVSLPVLGIVENMSGFACPHCGETTDIFSKGGGEKVAAEFNLPLLGRIPLEAGVVESSEKGVPVVWAAKESPAGQAFLALARAVKGRLKTKPAGR